MNNEKRTSEFTSEELEEILRYAEEHGDAPKERRFPDPDPYAKPEPPPEGMPRHFWFDEEGHICVKNFSAYWLPDLTLKREIGGTVYSISGAYEGLGTLDRKAARIMEQVAREAEGHR